MADPDSADRCVLRVRGVAKAFSGIQALGGVSFDLRQGEIHALVGENGAGKSTLIKIVAGAYLPDTGEIEIDGTSHAALTPEQARHLGVGVVYQEFNLLPELSVAENIFLGDQPTGWLGLLDAGHRRRRTLALLNRLGAHLDPDRTVKHLTVGEQQIVEIAKALAMDVRILIMDEPTAALGVPEQLKVLELIRTLRSQAVPVILISHNMQDVFAVADRAIVMRRGSKAGEVKISDATENEVVSLMVGAEYTREIKQLHEAPEEVHITTHDESETDII